jgi:hypothetical protein
VSVGEISLFVPATKVICEGKKQVCNYLIKVFSSTFVIATWN